MRNSAIYEALKSSELDDWEFVVVKIMQGADGNTLTAAEHDAINAFNSRGIPLLNKSPVIGGSVAANAKADTVITYEGKPVTYRQAAEILGCSVKTVSKRAARYRKKGSGVVQVEDWMNTTLKYRPN